MVIIMRKTAERRNTGRTGKFRMGIAALAGALTLSLGAPFAASAQSARPEDTGGYVFCPAELDAAIEEGRLNPRIPYAKAALVRTADQAIQYFLKEVPWKTACGVALNSLFGKLMDGLLGETVSIREVTEQIVTLQKEMKKQVEDLKEMIGRNSELQDYRNALTSLETTMDILVRQVKLGKAEGASDQDELVRIADKLGSGKEWSTDGLIYKLTLVGKYLKGDNYTSKNDLFQLVTEMNIKKSMFSGEAMNRSGEYLSRAVSGYLYGTGLALRMLIAQRQVASFTEDDIARLNPALKKVREDLRLDAREIDQQIEALLKDVAGDSEADRAADRDGVLKRYNDFLSADRCIFINKGTASKRLAPRLQVMTNQQIAAAARSGEAKAQAGFDPAQHIHAGIVNIGALTGEEKLALIEHIRSQYPELTVREYLQGAGFDTSNLDRQDLSLSTGFGSIDLHYVPFRQIGYESYEGVKMNAKDKSIGSCNLYYKKGGVTLLFWEIGKEEGVVDGALAYFVKK